MSLNVLRPQAGAGCLQTSSSHHRSTSRPSLARSTRPPLRATPQRVVIAPCSSVPAAPTSTEGLWDQLTLVSWQLKDAVAKEDYSSAARLRDARRALLTELPLARQLLFHKLSVLTHPGAALEEKLHAIDTLGDSNDVSMVPALAALLGGDPRLSEAAEGAMWSLFQYSGDARIDSLMRQGMRLLRSLELATALEVFEDVVKEAPLYCEGHNKRATVLCLLDRWPDSIEGCKTVLRLQPFHFGAAAGMALCHVQLKQYEAALAAFDTALKINPGMASLAQHAARIREVHTRSLAAQQAEDQAAGKGETEQPSDTAAGDQA